MENDQVFVRLRNGYAEILDSKGYSRGKHLPNNNWVNVQVNGNTIMATNDRGYVQYFDQNGNVIGHG